MNELKSTFDEKEENCVFTTHHYQSRELWPRLQPLGAESPSVRNEVGGEDAGAPVVR